MIDEYVILFPVIREKIILLLNNVHFDGYYV